MVINKNKLKDLKIFIVIIIIYNTFYNHNTNRIFDKETDLISDKFH